MKIPHIMELLIAMAIIYFLYSTLVSVIFEWYSYKTQKRGRFLYETILKLLSDNVNQSYGSTLYSHFNISRLKKDKNSYPQYISAGMFADSLIDIIGTQSEIVEFKKEFTDDNSKNLENVELVEIRITDPYERFKAGVNKMNYSPLKSQLRSFYEKSANYAELKTMIMTWFDDYMARVSGWYKAKTKRTLFYIGLLVSLAFNVDSIMLLKKLNSDTELRKSLVAQAEQTVLKNKVPAIQNDSNRVFKSSNEYMAFIRESKILTDSIDKIYLQKTDSIISEIENSSIPVGYHGDIEKTHGKYYVLYWILGILISGVALSFGAPFWFDVMVKAINIRRSGTKPEKN